MKGKTNKKVEMRKTWVAPELKKTSIEQITANYRGAPKNDGATGLLNHDS